MLEPILDQTHVENFLKKLRSTCMTPERLVRIAAECISTSGYYGFGWSLEGEFMFVALTDQSAEPEQAKGDVSHPGVWLHAGADVAVAPYVLRSACQNGLSLPPRVISGKEPQGELEQHVAAAMKGQYEEALLLLEKYVKTAGKPARDVARRVEMWCAEVGGRQRELMQQSVMDYLGKLEASATEYDLINAMSGLGPLNTQISELAGRLVEEASLYGATV